MYYTYLERLINVVKNTQFIKNSSMENMNYEAGMDAIVVLFTLVKEQGGQVFFIGNGGSSAIASHMTADFMKNARMRTYNLYDNAVTTCMGNDYGYEYVFSKPLEILINQDDLLVVVSSSGNSKNIINAIEVAKDKNAHVITFTGFKNDNKVKKMGDLNVYVPIEAYGIVESIHNILLQQVIDVFIERENIKI